MDAKVILRSKHPDSDLTTVHRLDSIVDRVFSEDLGFTLPFFPQVYQRYIDVRVSGVSDLEALKSQLNTNVLFRQYSIEVEKID